MRLVAHALLFSGSSKRAIVVEICLIVLLVVGGLCLLSWLVDEPPFDPLLGSIDICILLSVVGLDKSWPHRLYAALPTSARERGISWLLSRVTLLPLIGVIFDVSRWATGSLAASALEFGATLLMGWCAILCAYFLCRALPDKSRYWRLVSLLSLTVLLILLVWGLLLTRGTTESDSPVWRTVRHIALLLNLLSALGLAALAWRAAASMALQSAASKVRRPPGRFRFAFRDVPTVLLPHYRYSAGRWLLVGAANLAALCVVVLSSYWTGDLSSWASVHHGLSAGVYYALVLIALCVALFADGQREFSSIRVLRALPLSSHLVHRRLILGSVVFYVACALCPAAVVVLPLASALLVLAISGLSIVSVPWVTALRIDAEQCVLGCFFRMLVALAMVFFVLLVRLNEQPMPVGVLAVTLAAISSVPQWLKGHDLIVRERVTPRITSTGEEQ